jgi:hypothetical protein
VTAGGLAVAGLVVLHSDAHSLYTGLLHGAALAVLIVSLLAGAVALGLVAARRFEPARYVAAVAVAAVVAGWAFARYPVLLPGLDVGQAAAPHDTLVAVVIAVLAGGRGGLAAAGGAGLHPVSGPGRGRSAHRGDRVPQRRRRQLGARDRRVRPVRVHGHRVRRDRSAGAG